MDNPFSAWGSQIVQPYSRMRRVKQIDDVHCGPAVLQMVMTHIGIDVSQLDIDKAIHAEEYIEEYGTRPDQLAAAVKVIAPQAQLWCKEYTSTEDLVALVQQFMYPVAVEWQNLFYDSIQEEYEDTNGHPEQQDFGHYSIISSIDPENDEIVMVDPYHTFNEEYRYFSLKWFESRWWDDNETKDPHTGHIYAKRDRRLCFIVTMKGMPFPKLLGMRPL
ncbi:MAG: C39 family peptidase [Candidatus Woesebacteria bacterium]